ncbi:retron Ec67 family RNA-directed DNA polymerase/endonuclease [Lentisalinibacter sediminis]|uniref:retron Ec67 family RNA-directed DNA polymerase/endonuclease n=1 Tax=Lentisalinibacter sediminis TaxID=2992237 RepID=UPI00386DA56E
MTALQSAKSLSDLAPLLGFEPKAISYILYKTPDASKYSTFEISKRYGGTRTINAPNERLKLLQKRTSELLQNCEAEIKSQADWRDQFTHGFKRKRSIITNAKLHRGRRYVFNLDLHDFFGTINFGRVRGFFIKDKGFSLNPAVATVIAQIACHNNCLPQGSPCSPVISNLIGHILDVHLVSLASRQGCTYSRYADDLTFSTNRPKFPASIAVPIASHVWAAGPELSRQIHRCGFEINDRKTRMQYRNSRQEVTGLVVNKKLNVRREYRHNVRAMVHHLFTTGSFDIVYKWTKSDGTKGENRTPGTLNQLHGMLGFIDSIDVYNRRLALKTEKTMLSKELMYRQFLLFKEFYAAQKPVIICEGPTDNVYVLHAIRSLAARFPGLAEVRADGSINVKVRIYKYAGTSTGRILGLTGGASRLAHLIHAYRKESRRFSAPGKFYPVILVVDNDSGSTPVFNAVKEATGKKPTGSEAFIHVTANMYVVPIPEPRRKKGKGDTKIEDLFSKKVLAAKVGGKSFHSAGKGFDESRHYGKTVLAHKVIRPNAEKINFRGFRSLLANIKRLIDEHTRIHGSAPP